LPASPAADPFLHIRRTLALRRRRVIRLPSLAPAAVLVPLLEAEGELHVLFTLRTQTVKHHKGQVSFPGGARQAGDRDLLDTALRESEEEIGLDRREVEILGALDDMITISYFQVTPWVARIPWPLDLVGSEHETADIFTVPVARLLDPALCRLEAREHEGRSYYPIYFFSGGRHVIWGITGHILAHLLELCFAWRHPELRADEVNLHWER
jgi:8-oxo-dGTP pyrophosphatase MutT (NUDIX family)